MTRSMEPVEFFKELNRETTIRRDSMGRWYHDGQLIEHPAIIRAFDSWIDRGEDGRFCLKNQVNWVYITIEGPPLFVRSLRLTDSGGVVLSLSDNRKEWLNTASLRQSEDGALYCDVREGRMVARFDGYAMVQFESVVDEDEQGVFLKLGERIVRPPVVSDPLQPLS